MKGQGAGQFMGSEGAREGISGGGGEIRRVLGSKGGNIRSRWGDKE